MDLFKYSYNLIVSTDPFEKVSGAFNLFQSLQDDLLNFDEEISKIEDFALLRDEIFGIFNFTLNIIDSFDIVLDNTKVQQILEALIAALKPAHAKSTINYIR